jgi:histone H3/H4
MEMEMTIDSLIRESIRNALSSEAIAERVQKAADKAVFESIESVFGYSSAFRKGVSDAIAQALPITRVEDMALFSNAVRELLQKRLANLAHETAAAHLEGVLKSLLPNSTEIGIDELKKAYIDKLKSEASLKDCHCEEDDDMEFAWNIENSEHRKYWDLWMSPNESDSRYRGDEVVVLRFKPSETPGLHECWHASVGHNDKLVNSIFSGPLYGFDAMVFRLATGTAKLRK